LSIVPGPDVRKWAQRLTALLDAERPDGGRWTVTAIKKTTGVSRATLHAILTGGRKKLGVQTLRRLEKLPVAGVAYGPALAVREPPGPRYDARLTETPYLRGRVTDDLQARSVAELRLMLRGAMMGGAQHDRLLDLLNALERALDREGPHEERG
jgi:hypothetical protein